MALPSATDVEQIGTNGSGGMCLGASSSELVAFHGATPTDQYAAITSISTSAPITSCGVYGFTTTQAAAIIAAVNSLIAMVNEKGLTA